MWLRRTSTDVDSTVGPSHQRLDIQGMRGIAVLLVVLSHAHVPWLAGGYVGVDVFFVLSGYLITSILVREGTGEGGVSIARFYGNRAKRIAPAAAACLLVTGLAGISILGFNEARQLVHDVWSALFFYANWHFALDATNYFAQGAPQSAVQHFWSLAVEEQFYLVWPLLVGLSFLGLRGGGDPHRRIRPLGALLAVIVVCSFAWSIIQTDGNPTFAYFSTFTRAWELGVGGLLAIAAPRLENLSDTLRTVVGWVGVVAVLLAAVLYTEATPFPGYAAALPVLGAGALLVGGLDRPRYGARLLLEVYPLRWVGDISYSLYLWHWPFLILGAAALGHALTTTQALELAGAAVVVAAASYYAIENPIRRNKHFTLNVRDALIVWPAAFVLVALPVGYANFHLMTHTAVDQAAAAARGDAIKAQVTRTHKNQSPLQVAAALVQRNAPLPAFSPSGDALLTDQNYMPEHCIVGFGTSSGNICEMGKAGANKSVVLMGDSTAAMLVPGMSRAAKSLNWSFRPIIKYQCPAPDVTQFRIQDGKRQAFGECGPWRTWAFKQIKAMHPDLVILVGLTQLDMSDARGKPVDNDEQLWEKGTERTVRAVRFSAGRTVVLGMLPRAPDSNPPADCLTSPESTMATCSFPVDSFSSQVRVLSETAAKASGARYADWTNMVCDQGIVCPMVIGSDAVWLDSHHWTATFSRDESPVIKRALLDMM